jgi:isoleucyl-tRNA synthetase
MLSRLQSVITTCREAYAAYDFRKVYQTLNQFVTVDISALYVDITKDRLYCDAADSPRRRATQRVMQSLVDALCRLLAPILAFTADEAWEFSGAASSVHVELFPQAEDALRDPAAEALIEEWLKLRGVVGQAVEPARQQKVIGNALEASVTIAWPDAKRLAETETRMEELEEFLILSEVRLAAGGELTASLVRNESPRCARCWRYRKTVGSNAEHAELCDRCARVLTARKSASA